MLVGPGYSYNDILILPRYSDVLSRQHVNLSTELTPGIHLRIPVISSCMDTVTEDTMATSLARLGGLGIIHRFCSIEDQVRMVQNVKLADRVEEYNWRPERSQPPSDGPKGGPMGLLVGAAVGATEDYLVRAAALINAGVDILCIDIAHGHNYLCGEAIKSIKAIHKDIPIIAGNVCTPEGVEYLADCGADVVRINIGAGSICTTRVMTGCGYPQFSAVLECSRKAKELGITTIADGGFCGQPGNLFKALAAGATAVMLGKSIAGTTESPMKIIEHNGERFKPVRGMAGKSANVDRSNRMAESKDLSKMVPEGVEGYVTYKGDLEDVLRDLLGGIKSGMSYQGCHNIKELHELLYRNEIRYCVISSSGLEESRAHGLRQL